LAAVARAEKGLKTLTAAQSMELFVPWGMGADWSRRPAGIDLHH